MFWRHFARQVVRWSGVWGSGVPKLSLGPRGSQYQHRRHVRSSRHVLIERKAKQGGFGVGGPQRHSQPAPSKAPTKPAQARPPACEPGPVLPPPPPPPSPTRPAEQANGTTADSESRRSPRERSPLGHEQLRPIFNLSEPGPLTWPCTEFRALDLVAN
jgi:hypothetical protein